MKAELAERLNSIRHHLRAVTLADVFDVRAFGFALGLAWASVVFFSTVIHFSTRNDVSHFNSVVGFSSIGTLVVLFFGAFASGAFVRVMRCTLARWAVPLLMTVATIVLSVVDHDVIRQPWCTIASTGAGMGLGVLYLAWGEEFSSLGAVQSIVKTAASFLLAAVLFALVVALPRPVAIVLCVLLPLVVGLVLFGVMGVWRTGAPPVASTLRRGAFSIRAVLSLGVLSLAESCMRALFFNASPIINEGSYPWLFLVATIASIALVCIPLFSTDTLGFGAACRVAVFVLGFIFLLLPLLDLGSIAADVLALLMYCTVMFLVWIVLVRITGLYRLAPLFAFGVGWGAHVAGSLAGTFGGALIGSYFELDPRTLSFVALVCVCLLAFAYLFLFTERSMARLLGLSPSAGRRPFRVRCEQISAECKLTPREEEVMVLVAKGRSMPRIQQELGLTAGTVNTHVAHLYRKLDVHDKQELIDLLEHTRSVIGNVATTTSPVDDVRRKRSRKKDQAKSTQ